MPLLSSMQSQAFRLAVSSIALAFTQVNAGEFRVSSALDTEIWSVFFEADYFLSADGFPLSEVGENPTRFSPEGAKSDSLGRSVLKLTARYKDFEVSTFTRQNVSIESSNDTGQLYLSLEGDSPNVFDSSRRFEVNARHYRLDRAGIGFGKWLDHQGSNSLLTANVFKIDRYRSVAGRGFAQSSASNTVDAFLLVEDFSTTKDFPFPADAGPDGIGYSIDLKSQLNLGNFNPSLNDVALSVLVEDLWSRITIDRLPQSRSMLNTNRFSFDGTGQLNVAPFVNRTNARRDQTFSAESYVELGATILNAIGKASVGARRIYFDGASRYFVGTGICSALDQKPEPGCRMSYQVELDPIHQIVLVTGRTRNGFGFRVGTDSLNQKSAQTQIVGVSYHRLF